MKNKSFDYPHRSRDLEFQKSSLRIIFSSSEKKLKKSLTIKDVFYESVNFRWNEPDEDFFN